MLLLRRRGSGRSRGGRAPGLPRGACAWARGVLLTALAASSGRHAEPSPGKSGARAAGPGTQAASAWDVDFRRWGTALRESARSGSTLKVPGESPKLVPGALRRGVAARGIPAGHLAERASFLPLRPGRRHPGLGWAAASSAPSSPRNFFYSSQRAASTWGSEGPIPASGVA